MKPFLTNFDLKIIALITMTIDHIGYFLFPQHLWLRYIGRIAFPLYAYLIGQGFIYTKNKLNYLFRLTFFAIMIELILSILNIYAYSRNIFITLAIGLVCLIINESYFNNFFFKITIGFSGMLLADFLNSDYGWYGVFIILIMYYLKNNLLLLTLSFFTITYLFENLTFKVQWFAIFSIIFIALYNNQKGYTFNNKILNYLLFYGYYPLHIIILNVLNYL